MRPGEAKATGLVGAYLRKLKSKGLRGLLEYAACRAFPLKERVLESYFEWRLGIETMGEISPVDLGHQNPCANGYMPTFYSSNLAILRKLRISPERDVFIDFGSGKGRVVVLAALYQFRKVVGVEFSAELNEIARQNAGKARGELKCRDVELVTADAAQYVIPSDATVFYLANPFSGQLLDAVLQNIQTSLVRNPRSITLISHSHAPTHPFEQQIRSCPWLKMCSEIKLQCWTSAWIYTNLHWNAPVSGD